MTRRLTPIELPPPSAPPIVCPVCDLEIIREGGRVLLCSHVVDHTHVGGKVVLMFAED